MRNYTIVTDSGCDLSPEVLAKWGFRCIDLTFRRDGDEAEYTNRDMRPADFYSEMRQGTVFQTAAVNPGTYLRVFREVLKTGGDLLYICFSSGLSSSKSAADMAAAELAEEFPEQKVVVLDSLCGSGGQGLLLCFAAKQPEGLTVEEAAAELTEQAKRICHWFTVDDLKYLKRGGRIRAAEAFAATVLDIRPVMHMDGTGRLAGVAKVRGRTSSLKALAEKYRQLAEDPEHGLYIISHAGCLVDALTLKEMLVRDWGNGACFITDIGPVIGAHSGPGTLALFFCGKQR